MRVMSLIMPSVAVPAQHAPGLISDTRYISPQFGYAIEWSDDWTPRERKIESIDGEMDVLVLRDGDITLTYQGRSNDSLTPQEAIEEWIDEEGLTDNVLDSGMLEDVPGALVMDGTSYIHLEAFDGDDAGAVILALYEVPADEDEYRDALKRIRDEITLYDAPTQEGTTEPEGDATQEAEPEAESGGPYYFMVDIPKGMEMVTSTDVMMNGGVQIASDSSFITVLLTEEVGSDMEGCLAFAEDFHADSVPELVDDRIRTDEATAEYEIEGGDKTLLVHCQVAVEDDAVFVVTNIVDPTDVAQGQDDMDEVIDGLKVVEE